MERQRSSSTGFIINFNRRSASTSKAVETPGYHDSSTGREDAGFNTGYNQVNVDTTDREKTTFTTPWGAFMYARMPFGLTNTGATFQRAMDIAFMGQIEEMSELFKVQISSDLIRRLLGEEDQKPIRKPKPKVVRPEHPSNQGRRIEPKPSEETGGWQSGLPSLLPLGVLPPVADKELDPIRKVINESEGVIDELHKKEARALEEVNRNAKELREKEYKMPEQRTIPCLSAKDACVQCYKDHPEDPLQCAEAVKAFSDCARQVQQQFVASG